MAEEKQTKEKIDELEKLVSEQPDSVQFVELAKLLFSTERHQEAIKVCENGLKFHPDNAESQLVYGQTLLASKRFEDGIQALEKASALRTKNVDITLEAAKALVSQGHSEAGLHFVKKVLDIDASDPRAKALQEYIRSDVLDDDPSNETRTISLNDLQSFSKEFEMPGEDAKPGSSDKDVGEDETSFNRESQSPRLVVSDELETFRHEEELVFEDTKETDSEQSTVLVDLNQSASAPEPASDFVVSFQEEDDISTVFEHIEDPEPARIEYEEREEVEDERLVDPASGVWEDRTERSQVSSRRRRTLITGKLLVFLIPVLVVGMALGIYTAFDKIRAKKVSSMLEQALTSISQDTMQGYYEAMTVLNELMELNESNQRVKSLMAFLLARISSEYGPDLELQRRAQGFIDELNASTEQLPLENSIDLLWARYHINNNSILQQEVNTLVKEHSENPDLLSLAGELAKLEGRHKEAKVFLKQSLDKNPSQVRTLNVLAALEQEQGKSKLVMEHLERALSINAFHVRSLLEISKQRIFQQEDLERVKIDLDKVLASPRLASKQKANAYMLLANIKFLGANRTEAVQAVQEAYKLAQENTSFLTQLAELCHQFYELDQAQAIAAQVLESSPNNVETRLFLCGIALLRGRAVNSLKALDALAGTKVPTGPFLVLRGETLLQLGRYGSAYDDLSKVPDDAVDKKRARALMVLALLGNNDQEQAYREAVSLIQDAPGYALAHYVMGRYRLSKKSYGSASDSFHKAVSLDPGSYRALTDLGWMTFRQKDIDSATKFANQAVMANPYDENALVLMGELRLENRDAEGALVYFSRVVQENENSKQGLLGMAEALMGLNKLDKADQAIKRAKEVAGQEAVTYHLAGRIFLAQNRYLSAKRSLIIANRLDERNPRILADLGLAQLETRAYSDAIQSFKGSLKVGRLLEAQYGLARAWLAQGNFKEAAITFEKAADQAKEEQKQTVEIASLFLQAGKAWMKGRDTINRFMLARKVFRKAVELVPNDPQPLYLLALALDQGDRLNKARQAYLSVLQLDTYHALSLYRLGLLEYDEENDSQARKYLERFLATEPKGKKAKQAFKYLREIEAGLLETNK